MTEMSQANTVRKEEAESLAKQLQEDQHITEKFQFRGHLDSVRGVHFVGQENIMASISEDCTVKLWDLSLLMKNEEEGFAEGTQFDNINPYYTLRGHTGPLFCITGSPGQLGFNNPEADKAESTNFDPSLIYTAGMEGIIKIWKVPDPDTETFSRGQDAHNYGIGMWNGHNSEPIWDLKHHSMTPHLLSLGADDSICLWKVLTEDENLANAEE